MQLGITDSRYKVVNGVIQSIVKTNETTGNMMMMVQGATLAENEKLYAAFMVSKHDIQRKLAAKLPPFAQGILGGLNDD
jgi:hypothetical protein